LNRSAFGRAWVVPALAIVVLLVFGVGPAEAAPGDLDLSFGSGGVAAIPFDLGANALALQADGKLIVAGSDDADFALARYKQNGALDPTFGAGGKVTTEFGNAADVANAVAVQPDGKIVAAGYSLKDAFRFALARYNANGSLDSSFGSGGKLTTAIPAGVADAVAVQLDGKIIAAGISFDPAAVNRFALVRYKPDGSLDTSFGSTGKVTTTFGSGNSFASAVALQPDGKILAAGQARTGSDYVFALGRYESNGSLDPTFGSGGKVVGPYAAGGLALALQPDGKIVTAGLGPDALDAEFVLVRYDKDGLLDMSFGSHGRVGTALGGNFGSARGVALQADGKIVAAGESVSVRYEEGGSLYEAEAALTRYEADGSLDTGFGMCGRVKIDVAHVGNGIWADVALQPDGKIVAAGSELVRILGGDHASVDCKTLVVRHRLESGKVTSNPAGINCGSDECATAFPTGSAVTLMGEGPLFAGWEGDCSGRGPCEVTMSTDRSVTAVFGRTLKVEKKGTGAGTVTSFPGGIFCGPTCSAVLPDLTSVTLTATPKGGSRFSGWGGACSGRKKCTLVMSADRTASATFSRACLVPGVTGRRLKNAKRVIRRAHCSVGRVRRVFSSLTWKHRVISQRPKPGAQRRAGAKVRLVVGKGPRRH